MMTKQRTATQTKFARAIESIGVPLGRKADTSTLTDDQERIRATALKFITEPQADTLLVAGQRGWRGRSIVVSTKTKLCAVSIEKDGTVAWIMPDGKAEAESHILKHVIAGATYEAPTKH